MSNIVLWDEQEKKNMGLVNCSKVYVDNSTYGLGVFTKQDIKQGEIIETGLMMRIKNVDGNENEHLFTWSDDRQTWAAGSGCLPFYNHTSENPNMKKCGDLVNDTMVVVALRDIKTGEELLSQYYSASWRKCFSDLK
jgi:SET domain-containing protein